VLGVSDLTAGLDGTDGGHAQDRRELRILTVGFEDTPAQGHARQVEIGRLHAVNALGASLAGQDSGDRAGERRIERGADADRGRQLGDELQPVGDAVGSIGQRQGWDAEVGNATLAFSSGDRWRGR